jgi:hypothetical protein
MSYTFLISILCNPCCNLDRALPYHSQRRIQAASFNVFISHMICKGLKNKNYNFMKLVMYSISLMNTTSEVHV